MFGKILSRQTAVSLVLLGFCIYIVKLSIDGTINLYIHPRYSLFSLIMSSIAAVVLLSGLVIEIRKKKPPRYHNHASLAGSGKVVNTVVGIVLLCAFLLPPQTLSSEAIGQRVLKTPSGLSSQSQQSGAFAFTNATCPDTMPNSIDSWVYEMNLYPMDCFEGQPVALVGFVFESPASPLPNDMYYLARVVVSCCTIDAQPYALPIQKDDKSYPKNSWWKIEGVLKRAVVNGVELLVVEPTQSTMVKKPSNPYEYINTAPALSETVVPIEQ